MQLQGQSRESLYALIYIAQAILTSCISAQQLQQLHCALQNTLPMHAHQHALYTPSTTHHTTNLYIAYDIHSCKLVTIISYQFVIINVLMKLYIGSTHCKYSLVKLNSSPIQVVRKLYIRTVGTGFANFVFLQIIKRWSNSYTEISVIYIRTR